MELKEIQEGLARILVPKAERIYDSPVFYNPKMSLNRDISVFALKVLKPRTVLDALSATGIRGIRYALETPAEEIWLNDINPHAFRLILKNIELNFCIEGKYIGEKRVRFDGEKPMIANLDDANRLMAEKFRYFDFLDLDPFGSPVEFLDTSLRSVRRNGVLAVTATDTGVLCGAYRQACLRKYLSIPIRGELCHEAGLRILVATIARYAAKYDLGIEVLLAYYRDHYFRVFLRMESGARVADRSLKRLGYLWQDKDGKFEYSEEFLPGKLGAHGPMWLGPLKDDEFVEKMLQEAKDHPLASRKTLPFLELILEELDLPFYYETHAIARRHGIQVGKLSALMERLREEGFKATRTHFSPTAIKTDAPFDVVLEAMKRRN